MPYLCCSIDLLLHHIGCIITLALELEADFTRVDANISGLLWRYKGDISLINFLLICGTEIDLTRVYDSLLFKLPDG